MISKMALEVQQAEIEAKVTAEQANLETKLRNERTNLRRLFTVSTNTFDEIHRKTDAKEDIHVQYNKVVEKAERLFKVDEEIKELINFTDEDYDKTESYRDRFTEIRVIYEKHYNQLEINNSVISSNCSPDNLKLPKLRLKEYDLIPRSWVAFWGQFRRIHEDESLREEDKFQYLLSSLKPKTKARDIAESYPPSKDNYAKVIDHLESRFGRKDLLIEVYIRDLLALVNSKSNIKLTDLYDKLGSYLRALETLGVTTSNYAAMLYPVVESCLPSDILKAWDRHRLNKKDEEELVATKEKVLENLMSFLRHEVEGEEHRFLAETAFGGVIKRKDSQKLVQGDEPTAATLVANTSAEKISCIFSDRPHFSQDCQKISSMDYEDKKSLVMRKRCCLVCLKPGHIAKKCHNSVRCLICQRRHYALMCPDLRKGINSSSKAKLTDEEQKSTEILLTNLPSEREIYLKTIIVRLQHKGKKVCVRALMDDGSHRSYIEKTLVEELNLSPSGQEILSQGLFGGGISPAAEHGRFTVTVESLDRKYSTSVALLDQPKICSTLPRIRDENLLAELASRGIKLTDVGKDTPPIRILFGADVLGSILTGRIEVLTSGVSAVETLFGWTILGLGKKRQVVNMVTLTLQNIELPKIWDLEVLDIKDPVERKNKIILEEETLTHFRETIKVREDRRYEVALPWLAGHPPVYDMYDVAVSRLRSVTKRLLKENIYEVYDDVLRQWQREGIIEAIPKAEISKPGHYLPHRPVIKSSSATTKIRPVFDASFKRPGYASLNECLSVGPSLSEQIPPLLLRFRAGAIGVIADIKQAFLQLSVRPEDRDYLRFLWWDTKDISKLEFFRHCRVVFGVTSSPFLLNACIRHHVNSTEYQLESLQHTVEKLKRGFYVDNLTTSVESLEELVQFKAQAMEIMNAASFELRCWAHTGVRDQESQSVLGLKWDAETDELYCVGPQNESGFSETVTKRKLLSIVNSIYDPIGFTSPATLLPKLLLQEAWCNKLDWDEELPSNMQLRFQRWAKHLNLVEKCRIPRRILHGISEQASLHIFTDASAHGYACCAFLRCEEEEVKVSLVLAKARVAPVQRPTIPRLELLGAAIGARIASTILEALNLPLKTYFWTDSMIVLGWITNTEPWNTFVGNRVKEIRELTNIEDWRFVPGDINPADLPSRSCDWSELLRSQWWEGPKWLYEGPELWPYTEITLPQEALVERRKSVAVNLNIETSEQFGNRFLYFSSYPRIIRMTAWVLRFCQNLRVNSQKLTKELTFEEIQLAEEALIRIIQAEWSPDMREKYAKSIQFYEENEILKVRSRLILGQDPEDFIRPTVLPDHPIVRRLIDHTHRTLHHAGVQTTLSHLRERFWIPRGRRVVREVLKKCLTCRRYASKPVVPAGPAPLPIDRINRVASFEVTGADLAGPIYMKGGQKAWIVIFTCAVYRALHLELVTSMSTEAFMQALRRFFARRGRCSVMYTDNGTNFLGTSRALNTLNWQEIIAECAIQKIKWNFNPPTAPWYGGWWERMIRTVKQLLRKVLGRACVNYEEMVTLLCECESIVNGRPLTYIYDDPNELRAIKPSDFIQDIKGNETVDLDIIDAKHLRKRIRYLQNLRYQLRQRFQKEYLAELIRNPQLSSKRQNLSPGDIVLIGSENTKRLNWPLGRVIELFQGKDNIERVAKLRVANGEIIRPIQRIYPLEVSSPETLRVLPENAESVSDTNDDADPLYIASNEQFFKPHVLPKEQLETVKKTRSGRRIVPVKRLDL